MNSQLNSQEGFEKAQSKNRLQSDRVYMLVLLNPVGYALPALWGHGRLCLAGLGFM